MIAGSDRTLLVDPVPTAPAMPVLAPKGCIAWGATAEPLGFWIFTGGFAVNVLYIEGCALWGV
jgi:hypothetical protein